MSEEFAPVIFVDVYQSRQRYAAKLAGRPQTWRWRALSEGNRKKLASSGEAYINLADCLHAIELLFGTTATVFLRQHEKGNQLLRRASNNEPPF
jgi:uncharacterized protein YegP (UPF0339 family)